MPPSATQLPQTPPAVEAKSSSKQESNISSKTSRLHLDKKIEENGLAALWNVGANVTIPEPRTKHIPAVWRYKDTKALLLEAGERVPAAESERRALIMINPGPRKPPHTLDTILSAHQLLLPGEQALCHRHTPFAVRFLIEGRSG
jgi:gentisate 1,2-dioxygenase